MSDGASPELVPLADRPAAPRSRATGDLLAFSPLVGLLAAGPALVTALSGEAAPGAMAIVWGATSALAGTVAGVTRAALPSRWLRRWATATLLSVAPLTGIAALVKQVTHHRPLGAATIAVLGLVMVAGAVIVVHRAEALGAARSPAVGRGVRSAIEVGALVGLLGAVALALGWSTVDGRTTLIQLGLLVAGASALVALPVPRCAPARPLAVILLAIPALVAVVVALGHPVALEAATRAAPWLAPFAGR